MGEPQTRGTERRRLLWRTGRKVGRTIYAQVGWEASDDDDLIGVMDTRDLAQEAVDGHNAKLAQAPDVWASGEGGTGG